VADGDGVVVFVRNASGGVSSRREQSDGWVTLGGTDVQDGLVACAGRNGVEVFASTRQKVVHWRAARPGLQLAVDDSFPSGQPAGPPSVLCGDTPKVFYREPGTGQVAGVPGATGAGGLSLLPSGGDVTLWARSTTGGVAMATAGRGGWADLGGAGILDTPVALRDSAGRVVLVGASSDGRLMVDEQPAGAAGFGGWRLVGS